MKCEKCRVEISAGEQHIHLDQTLCEDCYMEALSPVRTCDPWAVHSAKNFEQQMGGQARLTDVQQEILRILGATGGLEAEDLRVQLGGRLTQKQLEIEFGTLRHMEKVRAEKRGAKVFLCLW